MKYEIAFFQFEFLLSFIILLFLLRIEEKGFDYKNAIGVFIPLVIYLISTTYHNLYMSHISLYSFLYAFISNLNFLLIPLIILYTLKIIYNLLIKDQRIRYPIIFFALPISFLLTGSYIYGFQKTLNFLIALITFVLLLSFYNFSDWIIKWFQFDSKKEIVKQSKKDNGIFGYISRRISEYKEKVYNREVRIEKSDYALNDEIRNAIINSKYLNLENRNFKELNFMLVCANQEAETLKNESNSSQNFMFTGLTLMIIPGIMIFYSFFSYLSKLQMNFIFNPANSEALLHGLFERILSKFDLSIQIIIMIIIMYVFIFIYISFFSLVDPNSRIKNWIRKRKITSGFYDLVIIFIVSTLVIKWILSINLDPNDFFNFDISTLSFFAQVFSIFIGLMIYLFGSLIISLNRKNIVNANKLILDLNNKIIFYDTEKK